MWHNRLSKVVYSRNVYSSLSHCIQFPLSSKLWHPLYKLTPTCLWKSGSLNSLLLVFFMLLFCPLMSHGTSPLHIPSSLCVLPPSPVPSSAILSSGPLSKCGFSVFYCKYPLLHFISSVPLHVMSSVGGWTSLWLQIMYRISPPNKLGQKAHLFILLYSNCPADWIDLVHGHFVMIFTSDPLMAANIQMVSLLNSIVKNG